MTRAARRGVLREIAHPAGRSDHVRAIELARRWGYARKVSPGETFGADPPRRACSVAAIGPREARARLACAARCDAHRPQRPPFAGITTRPAPHATAAPGARP